jgi:hypothetical protein
VTPAGPMLDSCRDGRIWTDINYCVYAVKHKAEIGALRVLFVFIRDGERCSTICNFGLLITWVGTVLTKYASLASTSHVLSFASLNASGNSGNTYLLYTRCTGEEFFHSAVGNWLTNRERKLVENTMRTAVKVVKCCGAHPNAN